MGPVLEKESDQAKDTSLDQKNKKEGQKWTKNLVKVNASFNIPVRLDT